LEPRSGAHGLRKRFCEGYHDFDYFTREIKQAASLSMNAEFCILATLFGGEPEKSRRVIGSRIEIRKAEEMVAEIC
jgi:hypothetical protein